MIFQKKHLNVFLILYLGLDFCNQFLESWWQIWLNNSGENVVDVKQICMEDIMYSIKMVIDECLNM